VTFRYKCVYIQESNMHLNSAKPQGGMNDSNEHKEVGYEKQMNKTWFGIEWKGHPYSI